MRKFITEDFEIDLSKLKITDNSENPWFSDSYFAKFTFPFDLPLTEDNNENLGFISIINANSHKLLYDGIYVDGNEMSTARCELIEINEGASLQMESGFSEFPNFNKSLSELPLHYEQVFDIYDHAKRIIALKWPEVNYNFPQIITDKIDTSEEVYWAFEGVINNYRGGEFLRNYYDTNEEITYNKNVIQPLPYALHVMKQGFLDAGYDLSGDILNIKSLQQMTLYGVKEYWNTYNQQSESISAYFDEYDERNLTEKGMIVLTFDRSVDIVSAGRYRIIGEFICSAKGDKSAAIIEVHYYTIYYRDTVLASGAFASSFYDNKTQSINITFDAIQDVSNNKVRVVLHCGNSRDNQVINLEINPIRLHDSSGEAIPTIINPNIIDLKKSVPNVTFGDYVNLIRNMYNLDMSIEEGFVRMNFIQTERLKSDVIDLRHKEVDKPKRNYTWGTSFLLKYDQDSKDEYKYAEVFHSANVISTQDFKTNDKTNEIAFNALPLPIISRNNINTSYAYEDDESKVFFILYDGLINSLNLAKENTEITIPYLHDNFWQDWIEFRIKSQSINWSFVAYGEDIMHLTKKSRIFAFNHLMLVKNISKTEVYPDIYEVELTGETET